MAQSVGPGSSSQVRPEPATSPEAQAAADLKADAAAGDPIAKLVLKLDERENGKGVFPTEEEIATGDFKAKVISDAKAPGGLRLDWKSTDEDAMPLIKLACKSDAQLKKMGASDETIAAIRLRIPKPLSAKELQRLAGMAETEEKNDKPAPRVRRSREAVAEAED